MDLENKSIILLMLQIVVLSTFFGISLGKSLVVGGSSGWTIPTTPLYSTWASQHNLQVGDVLVFRFPAGTHTVAEVSKANYDACTSTSTLGPVMTTAPASITLTKPGIHYFICTIPGHCSVNQKLTVTVAVATSTATPAPQPSPSSKKGLSPTSSPISSPASSPTFSPTAAPTPSPTAAPIASPASSPAPTPIALGPGIGSPIGGATAPAAEEGPSGGSASPPAGNFASSTGVSLLSLFSAVALALVF